MTASAFEIRPIARGEVGLLLDLISALAEYEHLAHLMNANEASLTQELFGEHPVIEALLGWIDGEAVAYALYFTSFSTFLGRRGLYLEDLFVRPGFRGRGFGKAMLIAVAQIAQRRGAGRLEWTALDWNAPALDFYKRLGATEMSQLRLFRVTGDALAQLGEAKSPRL